MDRPEMDLQIQEILVQYMTTEGAENHDLSGGGDDEFVFIDEDDVNYPESTDGSVADVTERMQNMASSFKDKKDGAPSTAASSTTAGGNTVRTSTTATSTSTTSTAKGSGGQKEDPSGPAGGAPDD